MPSKIILKKSSVAAKAPVAADLEFGELALNYTDSKLYFKKADGTTIDAFSSSAVSGTVTSVGVTPGTGISVSGSPITTSGNITVTNTAPNVTTDISITTNASNVVVNSSDGTDGTINAATTSLAGVMSAADKTKLDGISAGATANTGTVTSVATSGTVSGLTLTGGTITTSGTITLGGTLAVTPSNFASQTANTVLAAPNGAAGVPTFRALVAADVPTLNQNTTGASSRISIPDTRAVDDQPQNKVGYSITADFKNNTAVNNPPVNASGTYSHIITVAGWDTNGGSGGWPTQLSVGTQGMAYRQAASATTWANWTQFVTNNGGTWGINVTGTAANVTGTVAVANGGTGATTAAAALVNLGAYAASNPSGYVTTAGARSALSFTAGSGAYNSTTGVITIPTNTNQLTNGAGYITSAALSSYLPLTGGNLTTGASSNLFIGRNSTATNYNAISLNGNPADSSNMGLTGGGVGDNTLYINSPGNIILRTNSFGQSFTINSGGFTGNSATATTLQTARTINGSSFNGSANIDTTEWFHSDRDFPNGTLITTNINYAVSSGDPFVLEIRGNSYGNIIPLDLLYQGYIYADTIINHGGISNGLNITGLVAINNGGNLCFWFPSQGYWNGYNVKVYTAYATRATNRVTSISGVAKPTTAKEVALSDNIRQSLHSSNYNSYSPTLTGGGASGTWGINITGNAASATSASTANTLINNASISGLNFAGVLALSGSGASTSNSIGARLSENYGALWNMGDSATWHHQVINGSMLCGFQANGSNWGSGKVVANSDVRGTLFYDTNNTGYYADLNSTTYLYYLQSATTVRADSDRRLKENITPITSALSLVRQLQGCRYTRNDLADKTKVYIGMIAQDVLPIVPEVVSGSEAGKYSLGYAELVPVLNEAVKELDEIVSKQAAIIAKLEERLSKLLDD